MLRAQCRVVLIFQSHIFSFYDARIECFTCIGHAIQTTAFFVEKRRESIENRNNSLPTQEESESERFMIGRVWSVCRLCLSLVRQFRTVY